MITMGVGLEAWGLILAWAAVTKLIPA